jgi:hypothetical protein
MRIRRNSGLRAGIRRRALVATLAVGLPVAAIGIAAPAALASNPYSVFAQCPTTYPGLRYCLYGTTTSGEFKINKTAVPINKTIVIQGGALPTGTAPNTFYVIPAKNGESLSKTELNVPGGLLDLINCEEIKGNGLVEVIARESCKAVFENKETGVTATTESVASATNPAVLSLHNLFAESGAALTLPVRIHLKNPLLGNSCYIGSEAHPIQLNLTTGITAPPGPNKPIEGFVGEEGEEGEGGILTIKQLTLVENAFSVPTTEGCGEFLFVKGFLDGLVNGKIGLESKAGNNTAILSGEQKLATVSEVEKHGV